MKKQLPHILSLSTVAKSRLFEIQAVDLKFSNGIDRTYERFRPFNRDSVMVIAIDGEDLLLVREYAVGTEQYELGFVKGGMDTGETPEQSANRELQEEIAFGAKKWTFLRTMKINPQIMGHSNKLDFINYDLLSPYTVQKMFKGRETLQNLRHASGELSDIYSFHSAKIRCV